MTKKLQDLAFTVQLVRRALTIGLEHKEDFYKLVAESRERTGVTKNNHASNKHSSDGNDNAN